jgi:hypothetical protein
MVEGPNIDEELLAKGDEPDLGLPDQRPVTLRLLAPDSEAECNFWVGLTRLGGELTPGQILDDERPIQKIFEDAAEKGIAGNQTLLVTDTEKTPPRYMYFLSTPSDEFRERAMWLSELTQTIRSIQPGSIGFYIDPNLAVDDDEHELVLSILRELIRVSDTTDYYLLIGDYGLNTLLNAAVRLRGELLQDSINLYVFH